MYMVRAMAGERGASVVAALVLAAIFAGTAVTMNAFSPSQPTVSSQGAASADSGIYNSIGISTSNHRGDPTSDQKKEISKRCKPGYDIKVFIYEAATVEEVPVCPEVAKDSNLKGNQPAAEDGGSGFGLDKGRCVVENGKKVAPQSWKCFEKYCAADFKIGCTYSISGDGTKPVPTKAPTQTPAGGTADPSGTSGTGTQQPGVQANPDASAGAGALQGALGGDGAALEAQRDRTQEDIDKLESQYADTLKELGGTAGAAACAAGAGNGGKDCSKYDELQAIADAKNTKEAELKKLNEQIDGLRTDQTGLSADEKEAQAEALAACKARGMSAEDCPGVGTASKTCESQGLVGTYPNCIQNRYSGNNNTFGGGGGNTQTSAACQACQQNSENYNACMACRQGGGQGSNPFGQQGQQRGGQGGGSGAQQAQQQQQCQPKYQCSSNVVMYNACPNVNGNWQQVQQCQTGYTCSNNSCVAQAPYGYCTNGQPRTAPAQSQPSAASCTVGSWQDTSGGCQTSWQCVASGSTATSTINPTAQLSCQPTVADENTVISFSYACANGATIASSTGFTLTPSILSGSASTTATLPGSSGTTITYGLMCTNENVSPARTASAQCVVQVGKSSIVLVATPKTVYPNDADAAKHKTTIGWVTSGMRSCVIGNPDFPAWTAQQAGNTSVGGAVTSPDIPSGMTKTTFTLACTTIGGASKAATVEVVSE